MEKLIYEPLGIRHANALAAIWSDEAVIRFTNIRKPCTSAEILEKIQIFQAFDTFAVCCGENLIGVIGCPLVNQTKAEYGVFYQFCKSSWGRGYGTRAVEWLLGYMRKKYGNITFSADVAAENVASEKILRRLGFQFVSEEESLLCDGVKMKVHKYCL